VTERQRLQHLTDRWRRRRDLRRPAVTDRPLASPERQALAARAFPFDTVTPAAYVDEHGGDMEAFTYDDERYDDRALDAWIVDVGRLLRARSGR
jgi:hypothetical protein